MRYCKKCVQPDTRPNIKFDENGVCYACVFSEEAKHIEWAERERQLYEIAEWAKAHSNGGYECAIGVSGGKDSTLQALVVRDKLGLNCLLVNCAPDKITEVGRHNLENLVCHGFDMVSFRPNPKIVRKLTKRSFYEYGNPPKPTEYSLWAVTYQTALAFKIPLIIQGESYGLTLGTIDDSGINDNAMNINLTHTLAGGNASDWVGDGIDYKELLLYQFPDKQELMDAGIRAIYLQYYLKDWSFTGNTEFAVAHGLQGRPGHDPSLTGRLSPYNAIDSDQQIVNQMLKYYKLGFGFVTDEVCEDIRSGRLSREEAIKLVEKYDGKCDERYIREFCDYIDVTIEEFWRVVDRFVNKELFRKDPTTGKWKPLFKVGYGLVSE